MVISKRRTGYHESATHTFFGRDGSTQISEGIPVLKNDDILAYTKGGRFSASHSYQSEGLSFYFDVDAEGEPGASPWRAHQETGYLPFHWSPAGPHFGLMDQDTADGFAYTLLARTNPGRPGVSLPVFIGELRELPGALLQDGNILRGKGSGSVFKDSQSRSLSVQYGVLPLVRDVYSLLNLQKSVVKRMNELSKVWTDKGRRYVRPLNGKKGELYSTEVSLVDPQTIYPKLRDVTVAVKAVNKIYGVTTWKGDAPSMTSSMLTGSRAEAQMAKNHAFARDLLLGISSTYDAAGVLSDAWELMPWSWMIDWFGNFGDFLQANRNRGVATHGPIWIMQNIQSSRFAKTEYGDVLSTYRYKARFAANPSLHAEMPVFSQRQLSILTGLVATRTKSLGSPPYQGGTVADDDGGIKG